MTITVEPTSFYPEMSDRMPLTMASAGCKWRLAEVNAGHKLVHRLAELGLTEGVTLQVLQGAGGPLLVAVRGSRIAIGRGMAHKMMVVPVSP